MSTQNDGGADRSLKARHTRSLEQALPRTIITRGLSDIGQLAWLMQSLGYAHDCSEYEAALEGDNSTVPAMLGECLKKAGEALIAMTQEEVTELLADKDLDLEVIVEGERAYVSAGATPRARSWRSGVALARAGRTLSAANAKKLETADGHADRALKHHRALGEHHEATGKHLEEAQAAQGKAAKAHDDMGEALQAAKKEPEKAAEHVARALKSHKAAGGHMEDMAAAHDNVSERHQDAGDAHQSLGRSVKACQRCMRAVVDGSTAGAEDGDSKKIQTSDGDDESTGSEGNRSHAARLERMRKLAAVTH
jgi:tetratricopeptide (TPR) repeat protein